MTSIALSDRNPEVYVARIKDAMKAMENSMSEESIARSDEIYEREVLMLRLSELRALYKVRQADIKGFSQPAISRLEGRADIKLSTLVKYLTQMDLEMEIRVRPRRPRKGAPKEILLLRT